jgi:hypothetical protein
MGKEPGEIRIEGWRAGWQGETQVAGREASHQSGLDEELQRSSQGCWSRSTSFSLAPASPADVFLLQGMFVKYIQSETGTRVQIKGLGSGFYENETGAESPEPMHINIA